MSSNDKRLLTPLARVRGLGSAHDGMHHWWWQRLTAVVLVPLSLWFVYSLVTMVTAGNGLNDMATHLRSPVFALLFVFFIIALFWHAKLGLQVVIEDYVPAKPLRVGLLIANSLIMFAAAVISVFAIVKLHFGIQ